MATRLFAHMSGTVERLRGQTGVYRTNVACGTFWPSRCS